MDFVCFGHPKKGFKQKSVIGGYLYKKISMEDQLTLSCSQPRIRNECESSFFRFDLNISQLELVFSKELGTILYVNCDMAQMDFLVVYQWAKELYDEIFKK